MSAPPHGEVAMAVEALDRVIASAAITGLPPLLGELERLRATALVRMMTPPVSTSVIDASRSDEDRYLTMQEVKKRTGLSLSHLYQMGRTGELPVKPMGRATGGKKPRGYRVLLSDLLRWEAKRRHDSVDVQISNMPISPQDRRRVPAAPTAPRADATATSNEDRRPRDHALPMGARPERRA